MVRAIATENDEIVKAAVAAIQWRSQDDAPGVSAPENWRDVGIDLQYNGHVIVRLRPVDDDAARVEVFRREDVLADEVLRDYDSDTELADLVEGVHRGAIAADG